MRRILLGCLAIAFLISITNGEAPADKNDTVVYRGAKIHTAAGAPIDNGILVVHKGKIVAVGAAKNTTIPAGATVHNLTGKIIIPGLVDTHSHIGVYSRPHVPANEDGNEGSGAVQSGLRALDAIFRDGDFMHAVAIKPR